MMIRHCDNMIGGEGKTVHIDESRFGKRKRLGTAAVIELNGHGFLVVLRKEQGTCMITTSSSLL